MAGGRLRVDTLLARPGFQIGEDRRDQRGVDVADVDPGGRDASPHTVAADRDTLRLCWSSPAAWRCQPELAPL